MKTIYLRTMLTSGIAAVVGLSGVTSVTAADFEAAAVQPTIAGELSADTDGMYIVRLTDAPVATYDGGIPGYAATSAQANGHKRLNTNSKAARKYEKYLRDQQKAVLGNAGKAFGRDLDTKYDYQHAINGFALELTAAEAKALRQMDGVAAVERERMERPLTDAGPAWIGAPSIWSAAGGTQGEGLVVAILDTGINYDHPSFADVGSDGYDHDNPLGSGTYVPGSYCDLVDPGFCNDKLIGAHSFVGEAVTPNDSDGHGSHTAATVAGNVVDNATIFAPTTSASFDISGVAPHANIIAYDVCVGGCPGAALVAGINQVLIDAGNLPNGIAALNYSISGGGDPYNDTVELGFLSAVAAGIYVSASAGNNGPGPATVAHLGPWVSTTAASTHNRAIVNNLIDISSDDDSTADISGLGFTSGYGPAPIINSADLEGAFPGSTLCGLGGLGSFIPPWPPGTFNGEIVACTRGTFGRVEKGWNVLQAGAGGYVLMDNGSGVVGDAHVLPGIHISLADRAVLEAWLAANSGDNPMATIEGFSLDLDPSNGDVMAGFSSRGPNLKFDSMKPDVTAPGVSIFAAEADGQAPPPEYQFLGGTSMSSPHNAGSGALLTGFKPGWSPQAIKSAIMMTADTANMLKEDGATPADAFDHGAGRIDLWEAPNAGLVLNESILDYWFANPALGGDPRDINVASMQDNNCVGTCKWRRTVTGVNSGNNKFDLSTSGPAGLGLSTNPTSQIVVGKNKTKDIIVTADTTWAAPGWNFATLHIEPQGSGPDLHMPIAVNASNSTNGDLFNKTVDLNGGVVAGDTLTYEATITNGQLEGEIEFEDPIPAGTTFVTGSESESVVNGFTTSPLMYDAVSNSVKWSGELDPGGLALTPDPGGSPAGGYLPLSIFFPPLPLTCNGNCDDGGFVFNIPAFTYNGQVYSQIIASINGTIEAGTASGVFSSFANQNLPDPATPNNILAPFWRDLNLAAGGNMYAGVLSAGGGAFQWTIIEWEDVPHFGSSDAVTMQVWLGSTGTLAEGQIHFVYERMDNAGAGGTVGVENASGKVGTSYYYNGAGTAPVIGDELLVETLDGGSATLGFQVTVDTCDDPGIANEAQISNRGSQERAIATSTCAP